MFESPKMSRNRRKMVQKNQIFARGGFALRRQLKFDETGHGEVDERQRQLLWPFRDLQGFGKASHDGEDSGIGIEKVTYNLIDRASLSAGM